MRYKRKFLLLLILSFFTNLCLNGQNQQMFRLPAGATWNDCVPGKVIFRVQEQFASKCSSASVQIESLNKVFTELGIGNPRKIFPNAVAPAAKTNAAGLEMTDLSLIYEITLPPTVNTGHAINRLLSTGALVYAQPRYISRPFSYIPNDPLNFNQYHLGLIGSFQAWDQYRGDSNIVVGIVDWGTDIDHPDLKNNLKYNKLDPIDQVDNDNDGYTDNYMGWDMGDMDNNPRGNIPHGTFVAGLSSATTDNGTGISGTGFKCKFLPVKVCDSNNNGSREYEGIVYAAEHGCSIINCSWGNTFYSGPFGQDVINYASINRNALVIAACGNDNNAVRYYPASYDYVLSIAATNNQDSKWAGSSYGYTVDLCAPGESVWSTLSGGTYGSSSGTSFSAPVVAGCAAILKTRFPALSGIQIGEKLKVSADIIDTTGINPPYADLLGAGRVNIGSALNDTFHPSVVMTQTLFAGTDGSEAFGPSDTILVKGTFTNYLSQSTSALSVKCKSLSPYVVVTDSIFAAGIIPTSGHIQNTSHPFRCFIKPNVPRDEEIILKLIYSDNNYRAVQYISLFVNTSYLNIDTNQVATTLTSDGRIGYNNANSRQGLGFRYQNGETLMISGGLIVGKSNTQVVDAVYSATQGFDHDFFPIIPVRKLDSPVFSHFDAMGVFNDSLGGAAKINVRISQRAFAWSDAFNGKYIILEYTVANRTQSQMTGLYAGLFVDWDIKNYMLNRVGNDATHRMAYTFCTQGGPFTGVALVSQGDYIHYAFDNDGANGSINVYDGFTKSEKYVALKTNRNEAGLQNQGNDISDMVSSGPFSLAAGDSVKVAFALIAGDHLGDLQATAEAAYQQYNQSSIGSSAMGSESQIRVFPTPFKEYGEAELFLRDAQNVKIMLCSADGVFSKVIYEGKANSGMNSFRFDAGSIPAGVYILSAETKQGVLKTKCSHIK